MFATVHSIARKLQSGQTTGQSWIEVEPEAKLIQNDSHRRTSLMLAPSPAGAVHANPPNLSAQGTRHTVSLLRHRVNSQPTKRQLFHLNGPGPTCLYLVVYWAAGLRDI